MVYQIPGWKSMGFETSVRVTEAWTAEPLESDAQMLVCQGKNAASAKYQSFVHRKLAGWAVRRFAIDVSALAGALMSMSVKVKANGSPALPRKFTVCFRLKICSFQIGTAEYRLRIECLASGCRGDALAAARDPAQAQLEGIPHSHQRKKEP